LSSAAATVDTSFDAQCPILFSQADSFGKACLANAQPFTTYFDGEPEYHSAYIGFASPGSHFGLGCALNAHHQIAYLGIYYTLNTDDLASANSATITTVDFDGNIGVRLDGRLVNFIAIRPFETSTIPLPYYAQGAKNCESPVLSPGETKDNAGKTFFITIRHIGSQVWIRNCLDVPTSCLPDQQYLQIENDSKWDGVFVPTIGAWPRYLIEGGGGFLISLPELQKGPGCSYYYSEEKQGHLPSYGSVDPYEQVCFIIGPNNLTSK
jgi:hypothetical protein